MVADPAFGGTAADVVLHAPAREDMDRAVVHADWEVNGQLSLDLAQGAARVVGEADDVCSCVKTPLGGLVGGGAGFDRHSGNPQYSGDPAPMQVLALEE